MKSDIEFVLKDLNVTWRVFMKGLRFLRPGAARFEVHLTWPTGKTNVHGINLEGTDER